MIFRSIRGGRRVVFSEAIFSGLAPDGSLYVPVFTGRGPQGIVHSKGSFWGTASYVTWLTLVDSADVLRKDDFYDICTWSMQFPVPIRTVEDRRIGRVHIVELFHGPTLAFKDVGARFLAQAMRRIDAMDPPRRDRTRYRDGWGRPMEPPGLAPVDEEPGPLPALPRRARTDLPPDRRRPRTVLVATSGDTGAAAADAFHDLDGFRVVVLYPAGRVSPVQERQFTTLGGNVLAVRVDGAFDDCQRIAKEAFRDPALARRWRLTSANSVNLGRLMPQMAYYVYAANQLQEKGFIPRVEAPLLFSVPSGNLGNLTAGLYSRAVGLEGARFVAAMNRNDVFARYLRSGRYTPQESVPTLSSAMDVGAPSNLARIEHLYRDDPGALTRHVLPGGPHSDEATLECMLDVYETTGVLLDPHTAVGWLGLRQARREGWSGEMVLLATAHPAKFPETIERAVGRPPEVPAILQERLESELRYVDAGPTLESVVQAVERAERSEDDP